MEIQSENARKIGILVGTFDPIHVGHLKLGEAAYRQFGLDEVWFMPTGTSYCKAGSQVTSREIRGQMVEAAVSRYSYFKYSDLEIRREGATYTADTMEELRRLWPEDEFYYIVGADSLDYMEKWKRPEIIFACAQILVAARDTVDRDRLRDKIRSLRRQFRAKIWLLDFTEVPISSREIRSTIARTGHVPHLVPGRAAMIVRKLGLYRDEES